MPKKSLQLISLPKSLKNKKKKNIKSSITKNKKKSNSKKKNIGGTKKKTLRKKIGGMKRERELPDPLDDNSSNDEPDKKLKIDDEITIRNERKSIENKIKQKEVQLKFLTKRLEIYRKNLQDYRDLQIELGKQELPLPVQLPVQLPDLNNLLKSCCSEPTSVYFKKDLTINSYNDYIHINDELNNEESRFLTRRVSGDVHTPWLGDVHTPRLLERKLPKIPGIIKRDTDFYFTKYYIDGRNTTKLKTTVSFHTGNKVEKNSFHINFYLRGSKSIGEIEELKFCSIPLFIEGNNLKPKINDYRGYLTTTYKAYPYILYFITTITNIQTQLLTKFFHSDGLSETDHILKINQQKRSISLLNSKIWDLRKKLEKADSEFNSMIDKNYEKSVSSNTRPTVPKGTLGWGDGIGNRMQLTKLKED